MAVVDQARGSGVRSISHPASKQIAKQHDMDYHGIRVDEQGVS